MMDWQPISTAPKDGSEFLAYRRGQVRETYIIERSDGLMWVFGGSSFHEKTFPRLIPTHWKPLDEPPKD